MTPTGSGDDAFEVVVYPRPWRTVASLLRIVARGSLLLMVAVLLLSENPPTNPLKQMRLFAGLFAAPELAAWCVARAFAARARLGEGMLVLQQRGQRIEIPLEAIAAISAWRLPLPGAGIALTLRSGRRFARAIQVADPVRLAEVMVAAGARPELRDGVRRVSAVFAAARAETGRTVLENPVLKFVVFSLVPTLPAFRLNQFITYGGTFGEYYTFGLKAYLLGFGIWWVSWAMNVLLLAAVVRAGIEILAWLASALAPASAAGVRRFLEVTQRLIYYIGMPVWLILRLTA